MITPAQLASLSADLAASPDGERTATVKRWADAMGVSVATVYRRLADLGIRGPARPREAKHPQYREWAQVLMDLMARAPEGTIPLHLCLRAAFMPDPETGEILLPPEAERVPLATYQRIIRQELGGRQTHRRNRRMHADYPNQAWQLDATTSKYLIVEKALDDGDYVLRLWRNPMPASGYKNKPLGPDRLRLLYYGVWDMHTGYQWCAPQVARGESGLDAMQSLCDVMVRRPEPRDPLHGVPEDLWSDQGVLTKHAATADLLDRLGINVVTGEAYQKERMGGIEQVWRRLWQSFEASLFLCAPASGKWTILLSQLTARLVEYMAEVNARPCRRDKGLSRRDAWTRGINQHGGAKLCPDRPMETIAREKRCKVDGAGIITWDRVEYEVPKLHRVWVIARRALDGSDRVIVEDEATGARYDCTPYQPLAYGEHLRSPQLPIEAARTRARDSSHVPGDVYAPPAESAGTVAAPKVITGRFGPRSQPAADLPDPLEADRYASLPQAMAAFFGVFGGPLDADIRAEIEARIGEAGLDKTFVRDLALTLFTAIRTTGAQYA